MMADILVEGGVAVAGAGLHDGLRDGGALREDLGSLVALDGDGDGLLRAEAFEGQQGVGDHGGLAVVAVLEEAGA